MWQSIVIWNSNFFLTGEVQKELQALPTWLHSSRNKLSLWDWLDFYRKEKKEGPRAQIPCTEVVVHATGSKRGIVKILRKQSSAACLGRSKAWRCWLLLSASVTIVAGYCGIYSLCTGSTFSVVSWVRKKTAWFCPLKSPIIHLIAQWPSKNFPQFLLHPPITKLPNLFCSTAILQYCPCCPSSQWHLFWSEPQGSHSNHLPPI